MIFYRLFNTTGKGGIKQSCSYPHLYLCQRLTVLQESCEMARFLKWNKLVTSVAHIFVNISVPRRCQAFLWFNSRAEFFLTADFQVLLHQESELVDPEISIIHNQ
jgi:hypothetical protein